MEQQAQQQARAERPETTVEWAQRQIAGSFADADEAAKRLQLAARHCHLVGGASICPFKEGHEIVISVVPINRANCYPTNPAAKAIDRGDQPKPDMDPPKWGVGKADLMALAAAAAVEWTDCIRLDDGRDPRFCHYRVEGRYRQIDGSWRPIGDDRDVDVRDGSDQIGGMSDLRIASIRENMIRLAITKARLRALRGGFGIAHSMSEEELGKPFVFSRMVFTGRSNDPEVRRLFASVIAQQQLMATAALYGPAAMSLLGGSPQPVAALRPAAPSAGPAWDVAPEADDDVPPSDPPPPPASAPRAAPSPPPPASKPRSNGNARPPRGGWAIPGGRSKGTPLDKAEDKDLEYWAGRIGGDLEAGKTDERFRSRDEALLAAMKAEMAKRRPAPAAAPPDDDVPPGYEVDPNTGELVPMAGGEDERW